MAAHELRPDIVLIHVRMPGMGGMKAAELIRRKPSDADRDDLHDASGRDPAQGVRQLRRRGALEEHARATRLDEIWLQHGVRPSGGR